ncbi:MAG: hypothetical protein IJ299_05965 [Oscillospiraceae bacterium]|nr:hypothetical protein [Oscillospiraceae bacterium]
MFHKFIPFEMFLLLQHSVFAADGACLSSPSGCRFSGERVGTSCKTASAVLAVGVNCYVLHKFFPFEMKNQPKGVLLRTPFKPHAFVAARAADKLSRSSQRLPLMAKLKFCTLRLICDFAVIYNRLARKATYYSGSLEYLRVQGRNPARFKGIFKGEIEIPLKFDLLLWRKTKKARPAGQVLCGLPQAEK